MASRQHWASHAICRSNHAPSQHTCMQRGVGPAPAWPPSAGTACEKSKVPASVEPGCRLPSSGGCRLTRTSGWSPILQARRAGGRERGEGCATPAVGRGVHACTLASSQPVLLACALRRPLEHHSSTCSPQCIAAQRGAAVQQGQGWRACCAASPYCLLSWPLQ